MYIPPGTEVQKYLLTLPTYCGRKMWDISRNRKEWAFHELLFLVAEELQGILYQENI